MKELKLKLVGFVVVVANSLKVIRAQTGEFPSQTLKANEIDIEILIARITNFVSDVVLITDLKAVTTFRVSASVSK